MASDSDSGLDKQKILAAINHPDPVPYPPLAPAQPSPVRPATTRRVVVAPLPRWSTHRTEISAIIATFVALIWISAGIAAGSGTPILVGIVFGVAALAIWLLEVWSGD
ncbi:MAG TPA: hypothetical protein VNM14_21945 [Planctomycetota bacterium]|nr:hypothetical protein [Planctomycetota bacterium]